MLNTVEMIRVLNAVAAIRPDFTVNDLVKGFEQSERYMGEPDLPPVIYEYLAEGELPQNAEGMTELAMWLIGCTVAALEDADEG